MTLRQVIKCLFSKRPALARLLGLAEPNRLFVPGTTERRTIRLTLVAVEGDSETRQLSRLCRGIAEGVLATAVGKHLDAFEPSFGLADATVTGIFGQRRELVC
jgi:hypothetical protein